MKKVKEIPFDVLDTQNYREAYRDLIKSKTANGLTYDKFLNRMRARNIVLRKNEWEARRIQLRHIDLN